MTTEPPARTPRPWTTLQAVAAAFCGSLFAGIILLAVAFAAGNSYVNHRIDTINAHTDTQINKAFTVATESGEGSAADDETLCRESYATAKPNQKYAEWKIENC